MKVAFVTDDGKTISEHFGRARYFQVLTIEDGQVINREMREKPFHHIADEDVHVPNTSGQEPGADPDAVTRAAHHGDHEGEFHHQMADVISDCTVVVSRGMGRPMYQSLMAGNIRPILTDTSSIDMALQAFIEGTLSNIQERIH